MMAYLASLPHGVGSYPGYVQKASVYREFIEHMPLTGLDGLPAPVAELLTSRVPVGAWVPEVHAHALYLAIADVHLPDEEDFLYRKLQANRRMLRGPLYRLMMVLVSPDRLIRAGSERFSRFHRGITFKATQTGPGAMTARLDFPAHLVPDLIARSYAVAFRAAFEAAGGKRTDVTIVGSTATHVDFVGTWE
jgi:hypothetical protein